MAKKVVGIDVSDGWVTGVVLGQQAKTLAVHAMCQLPRTDTDDLASIIRQACQQMGWGEGGCVCGLPLSMVSVRNLSLPFKDAKDIAQTLPFELEEQLIAPVDTLICDFSVLDSTESNSRIVAFALEKGQLQQLLEGLQGVADPDIVTPAVTTLAYQVARQWKRDEGLSLLLHADLHSMSIILLWQGQPYLFRRLSYPEELIVSSSSPASAEGPHLVDNESAAKGIQAICSLILRSIDFFRLEHGLQGQPERVFLTGPLAGIETVPPLIETALALPVTTPELLTPTGVEMPVALRLQWQSSRFDLALALALQGFERKTGVNFRKDDFAPKRPFFASKKRLTWAIATVAALLIGFVAYGVISYRLLYNRDKQLREEMITFYKQTFPSAVRVQDPFLEMQAALKSVQGPSSPAPLFVVDKRVLGLLADVSARIPAAVTLQVSRLAIDRETIQIKGTTNTFNAVDTIKNNLSASSRYKEVKIVSATADKGKDKESGLIRFEIELLLAGL